MSADRPGGPSVVQGEAVEQIAGEDMTAEQPAAIQRLYDTAMERAAVHGSPTSQRYLSVLLAAV
jgi:hypothetical protein